MLIADVNNAIAGKVANYCQIVCTTGTYYGFIMGYGFGFSQQTAKLMFLEAAIVGGQPVIQGQAIEIYYDWITSITFPNLMAFGLKMFGCTVKNFGCNMGWGGSKSSVRVSLVEDYLLGDYFVPVATGTPTYVEYGTFKFWGLLQKWTKTTGQDGAPVYEVIIDDPRDILEGAQLILASYNGSTYGVPNLFNIYGYYEATGFGNSLVNESGMQWNLIKGAVEALTIAGNTYGGPVKFKGVSYSVDLSEVPSLPSYYRIGGQSTSLLSCITQVCGDSGCDFFVELVPNTHIIRIRTASRRLQPPLGVLTNFVDTMTTSGICKRSNIGLEARNETTSAFIVGGEVTSMYTTADRYQYFGQDANNNPIIAYYTNPSDPYSMQANLNATDIADIVGSNTYTCSIYEMLFAMSGNKGLWCYYLNRYKPALAAAINVRDMIQFELGARAAANPLQAQGANPQEAANAALQVGQLKFWNGVRLFEFIANAANQYLGKAYIIPMPFALAKIEPGTFRIINSYEPSTSGGYEASGVAPLGLNPIYYDEFSNTDGRFTAYCTIDSTGGNLAGVDKGNFIIDGSTVFMKCNIEDKLRAIDPITPGLVVTLQSGIWQMPFDPCGLNTAGMATLLGTTPENLNNIVRRPAGGTVELRSSALPIDPIYFTIPVKSNVSCYGPWYQVGAQGKVMYSHDTSLVPWNYGGSALMNLTAEAKTADAITFSQTFETGEFELVGTPTINMGDKLQGTGPNCTGIDVRWGGDGAVTTYRFQIFTQKFGLLGKQYTESMKNITNNFQKMSREVRQIFMKIASPTKMINAQIAMGNKLVLASGGFGPGEARRSSHPILWGYADDNPASVDGVWHTVSAIPTYDMNEAINAVGWSGEDNPYVKTAMMSMEGLIRPHGTALIDSGVTPTGYFATYTSPNTNYTAGMTVRDLDPFLNGNDIQLVHRGTSYTTGNHVQAWAFGGSGQNTQRVFSLRAPLVLNGWGYSVDDCWVPNADPAGLTGDMLDNYLQRAHTWKSGPMEILWDDERGVWTCYGNCLGKLCGPLPVGGSQEIELYESASTKLDGRKKKRRVHNFFSTSISSGTKIMANWVPEACSWWVVAADCPA